MTGCALTCSEPIHQLTLFRTGAPAGTAAGNAEVLSLHPAGAESTRADATVRDKLRLCDVGAHVRILLSASTQ